MKYIPTILVFIMTNSAFGQVDQNDTVILKKAIWRTTLKDYFIYYTSQPDSIAWYHLAKEIKKGQFIDNRSEFKKYSHSISLSQEEQFFLLKQIGNSILYIWPDSLLRNKKRIELDSLESFRKNENKKNFIQLENAKIKKDTLTYKRLLHNDPWVFQFSKPIYFRDNNFCIFYFRYNNLIGVYGGSEIVYIYKRDNGTWIDWIQVKKGDW